MHGYQEGVFPRPWSSAAWAESREATDAHVTGDITQLLLRWREGDGAALELLMPLVYGELRRLARQCMRRERVGHTLQTTALVNEAYLRLVKSSQVQWQDRAHFFAVAAQLMRRVLVDEARKRQYNKRGGEFTRITLDESLVATHQRQLDLLALDEALNRLAEFAPRKCRVVEMRFFGGLSIDETGAVLGVSTDIVKREWRTAKLWLLHELSCNHDKLG
ncbi:MAG: sigma-70 family RNA polymerase sigma factor [Acidobacteriota bacterium]|nr:sigma-70 family RNA polymerase sigma factor [Acidobacteriota bacterium]